MQATDTPLPESYWVIPGRFLAGEYPGDEELSIARRRLNALLAAGLDTFIDLTREGEYPPYEFLLAEEARKKGLTAAHLRFSIQDFGLPSPAEMSAILDALDAALDTGRRIYLHCLGGVGRTGTTVGCHLVRHGRSGSEALNQLSIWWQTVPKSRIYSHSPETKAQREFILNWHELA